MPQEDAVRFKSSEDSWRIDFSDTRDFLIDNWKAANEQYPLKTADVRQAENCRTYEGFREFLLDQQARSKQKKESWKTSYSSVALSLGRVLWLFDSMIQELVLSDNDSEGSSPLVEIKHIDTSSMWTYAFLNIKLTIDSPFKFRLVTRWMNELRRALELLISAVTTHKEMTGDENMIRTELIESFDPLISILCDSLVHIRRYHNDEEFGRDWGKFLENKTKGNLELISSTTRHIREVCEGSRLQEMSKQRAADISMRDRFAIPSGEEKDIFPVDHLPPFKSSVFIGRQENMASIHARLSDPVPGTIERYYIYGRRGIGKTQIALQYARLQKDHYDATFWIQCETKASLRQSFVDTAVKLELRTHNADVTFDETLMRVLRWLRHTQKKWLLIYDNAERSNLLKGYWPQGGHGSILITSRSYFNFFNDEHRAGETVDVLDASERRELFLTLLGKKWEAEHLGDDKMMAGIEEAAISTLLEKTGGLPIAITHAANMILDKEINEAQTVRHFMELFFDAYEKLPVRHIGERDPLVKTLDTIWAIAFHNLSSHADVLLNCLSLTAPDSLMIDLFLPGNQHMLTPALEFCKANVSTSTGIRQPTFSAILNPSEDLHNALGELEKKGLIRVAGREISIHRTVQEAVSFRPGELQDCFDAVSFLLYDAFPKKMDAGPLDSWVSCRMWIQHVTALAARYETYRDRMIGEHSPLGSKASADTFVDLLSHCAWYLFEIADYEECLKFVGIACSAATDQFSLTYAHLKNTEGAAYYEMNHLAASRRSFEKCLEIRRALLPPDHVELASILANLGNVETAEGFHAQALEYLHQAAAIRERIGDPAAMMLGLNYIQIGRVKQWTDENVEALRTFHTAEGVLNKKAGRNRFFTAYLHFEYGNLHLKQGEYDEAAVSFEKARQLAKNHNPLHPLVANANYKVGCAELEMRHHKRAMSYLNKALDLAEVRSLGEIDGTAARIKWKMAIVLLDDPLPERRADGQLMKDNMEARQKEIAYKLSLDLRGLDELQDREKSFDLLVPGYFR